MMCQQPHGYDTKSIGNKRKNKLGFIKIKKTFWYAWVAQLVGHLTLGFGSGHDLRVMRLSPASGFPFSEESASLFPHLSLPLLLFVFSLK